MNTLLKIEVAALALLVLASIFVRIGIGGDAPQTMQTEPPENTQSVLTEPTAQPTEPAPTAPEVVLTFGENFSLEARDYFIYDCTYDRVLTISGEENERIYPASITKLFTAYVALQYLQPEQTVTLGREVNLVSADSSLAYVKMGQTISVAELVEGMLLPSGNDAAYGLAAAAARAQQQDPGMDPEAAVAHFVTLMNDTAGKLGMTGSHFTNPDGYHDADHYTSSRDLMTIGKLALEDPCIRDCAGIYEDAVAFSTGDVANWHNTNALVNPESQYYSANAVGLKTGHTSAAGFCVLSAFEADGNLYVIGVFGCQRPEDRFIDALKLYDVLVAALPE